MDMFMEAQYPNPNPNIAMEFTDRKKSAQCVTTAVCTPKFLTKICTATRLSWSMWAKETFLDTGTTWPSSTMKKTSSFWRTWLCSRNPQDGFQAVWIGLSDAVREGFFYWVSGNKLQKKKVLAAQPVRKHNELLRWELRGHHGAQSWGGHKVSVCWGLWCQDRHHFICETRVFRTTLFPSIATMSVTSALPWFNLHMVFVRVHTYLRVCMCWARWMPLRLLEEEKHIKAEPCRKQVGQIDFSWRQGSWFSTEGFISPGE